MSPAELHPPTAPAPVPAPAAPEARLTEEQYSEALLRLRLVSAMVLPLDLNGILRSIAYAESVSPILDPTLYFHGGKRLEITADLVRAARTFQHAVVAFEKAMAETDDAAQRSLAYLRGRAQQLERVLGVGA